MRLQRFDIFICVFDGKFEDDDIKIFKELEATGRPCIYVRNKHDALRPNPRSSKTRKQLEDEVVEDLSSHLGGSRAVYFTSCVDVTGFEELEETIADTLAKFNDQSKLDIWLMTSRAHSVKTLERKYNPCFYRVCWTAGGSSVLNNIPGVEKLPGLPTFVNVGLMMDCFKRLRKCYGLEDPKTVDARLRDSVDITLIEHLATEMSVKQTEHIIEHSVEPAIKNLFKQIREKSYQITSENIEKILNELLVTYAQRMTVDGIRQLLSEYAASQTAKVVVSWVPVIGRGVAALIGARIIYCSGKKYLDSIHSISLLLLEQELLKKKMRES